jgi:hypothetical protein
MTDRTNCDGWSGNRLITEVIEARRQVPVSAATPRVTIVEAVLKSQKSGRPDDQPEIKPLVARDLVARDHVLRDALQADDGVGSQGKTPQLAVVPAEIVGGGDGTGAFHGGDCVGARNRGVNTVQIGGLNFYVADAFLPSQPILARE